MNNEQKYKEAIELAIDQISSRYFNGQEITRLLKEALEPPFEPVEGVVYAFWDNESTAAPCYGKFKGMNGSVYLTNGFDYDSCRPLTAAERGEE